jgi:pimeloyl-ACP methyl ester carboxylesterase
MMKCEPTLILFPGLGVNEKLFEPQQPILAKIIVPPWPTPRVDESLESYVHRIVASLPPLPKDYWIGGVSFGGIIALEAAKLLNPRGVFVIASSVHWHELSFTSRILARIAPYLPPFLVAAMLKIAPMLMRIAGRPDRRERELLLDLLRHSDIPLTRWGPTHISGYEFSNDLKCPIYRIHGADDRIIPFPRKSNVDLAVAGAGHVVNVTHASVVNQFIAERSTGF